MSAYDHDSEYYKFNTGTPSINYSSNIPTPLTKASILERLFRANLITFDELLILIQDDESKYVAMVE